MPSKYDEAGEISPLAGANPAAANAAAYGFCCAAKAATAAVVVTVFGDEFENIGCGIFCRNAGFDTAGTRAFPKAEIGDKIMIPLSIFEAKLLRTKFLLLWPIL